MSGVAEGPQSLLIRAPLEITLMSLVAWFVENHMTKLNRQKKSKNWYEAAESNGMVTERLIKRMVIPESSQYVVLFFVLREVLQAAACDRQTFWRYL